MKTMVYLKADWIKTLMENRGISKEQFDEGMAEIVSEKTARRVRTEDGKRELATIEAVAKVLGLSVKDLFEDQKNYNSPKIDWDRTVENIRCLMHGKLDLEGCTRLLGIDEERVLEKLQVQNKTRLTLTEVNQIAFYLQCDIVDLLVFKSDDYVKPADEMLEMISDEGSDPLDMVKFYEQWDQEQEIRDIYEFILYLPLVEENVLRDVVFRCGGDVDISRRGYIKGMLNYLYRTIRRTPEKEYADAYRDRVLRTKGDYKKSEWEMECAGVTYKPYVEWLYRYRDGESK